MKERARMNAEIFDDLNKYLKLSDEELLSLKLRYSLINLADL